MSDSPAKENSNSLHGKSTAARKRTVVDFEFGRILGEGSYSTVVEAVEKSNDKKFAAKVLSKRFIIKENKVKYVNVEKQALTLLSRGAHFIVRLHYTFQDPSRLFYIIDLAPNGDLLYYLKKKGKFELEVAQFYLAEIVSAIGYMKSKGVAHRDLKPENILLDKNMHIKITDFGSAKILSDTASIEEPKTNKTSSFVGTAQYASPELLEDKDANHPADLWALGCILYQFLVGTTPFEAANDYQIFKKIMALDYSIPDYLTPLQKNLIRSLLVKDPFSRLGYKDFALLKQHAFFNGIDFNTLHLQTPPPIGISPPLVEEVSKDEWFHLDESRLPLV